MNTVEKMAMKTADGVAANVAALKERFPEVVSEGKVDFDALKTLMGGEVAGDERYQFTWAGKRAAMIEAAKPITKTLRPCPEESKDWDTTKNIYIEGDNLDALKILQNTYAGKVKMIYIDPPYNTGHDFIYHDNFHGTKQEELIKEGAVDDETYDRFMVNTDTNGHFHSDWCSMMYPRLKLARQLLSEDGVIFISIDDNEVVNLKKACDEIFGEQNFVSIITVVVKPEGRRYGAVAKTHEFMLVYCRDVQQCLMNEVQSQDASFQYSDDQGGFNLQGLRNRNVQAFNSSNRPNLRYPFYVDAANPNVDGLCCVSTEEKKGWIKVEPSIVNGIKSVWRWGKETAFANLHNLSAYKGQDGSWRVFQKMRSLTQAPKSVWADKEIISNKGTHEVQDMLGKGVFDFPKPVEYLRRIVEIGSYKDAVVIDFFAGSSSTAHAVMQLNAEDGGNRKFIMVQLPEVCPEDSEAAKAGFKNICEIGKERIRRAGAKILEELKGKREKGKSGAQGELALESADATERVPPDVGFRVFKIDSSNMTDVFYAPKEVKQGDLLASVDHIKPDRKPIDLLYGCLVDWGLPIDLPHEAKTINGHEVFSVGGGVLMACFDDNVDDATVKAIAKEKPLHVLFRDTSFATSAVKINVGEIFKALSPETKIRVL